MARLRYVPLFRRRRMEYTDYRSRRGLVLSRTPMAVPRISGRNISVQVTEMTSEGDRVLASASSRELLQLGWKGSRKALTAAYLTGLLAGVKASRKGIKKAILYVGHKTFVPGSRIMAVVKGMRDGGVEVPADEEALPTDERIRGEHISAYAKSLLGASKEAYSSRFSDLLKAGFKPEEYPKHFEALKKTILQKYKVKTNE